MNTDREGQLRQAIAAQEQLRGMLPDEVVDVAVGALRDQLAAPHRGDEQQPRRRQATVLFADIAGFTAMSERLDAEVIAGLMNELWDDVDSVVVDHGGRLDKHIGDAVMGVWGADIAREDDPERAIRAALRIREAFEAFTARHDVDIGIRIGVNTGRVVVGEVGTTGEVSVTGDAVNLASRLEHAAPGGEVLISHDTYQHVRGVFDVRALAAMTVKGRSDPVRTYAVDRAKPRTFRLPNRGVEGVQTELIGRDEELQALCDAFSRTVNDRRAAVVTLVGEAGAGKSRLLDEFSNWLDLRPELIRLHTGRAVPDLQLVPRGLLREVITARFGISPDDSAVHVIEKLRGNLAPLSERDADIVAHWLGFDLASSPSVRDLATSSEFGAVAENHFVRYLRAVADIAPVVMLLEDVHWSDATSLDVVERLVGRLTHERVLVVCASRQELLEQRPDWQRWGRTVRLQALSEADTRAQVSDILRHSHEVPSALVDLIVERAGGNPFHVEELIRILIDDGVIVVDQDGPWSIVAERLEHIEVPATLTGVMQARLDRLAEPERSVLQHASVVGRTFWDRLVRVLLASSQQPDLPVGQLNDLLDDARRHELVRYNRRSTFAGCAELTFRHALLRDATYETVLLAERRRLHAEVVKWLEAQAGDRRDEHLGLRAEHLERAGEYARAADLLDRAAERAAATGSLLTAAGTYEHSLRLRERAGDDHGPSASLARVELSYLLGTLGSGAAAEEHLEIALVDAERLGDPGLVTETKAARIRQLVDRGEWQRALEMVEETRSEAEAIGGEPLGRFLLAEAALMFNGIGDLERAYDAGLRARALWSDVGHSGRELAAINYLAITSERMPGHASEADAWYEQGVALARRTGDIRSELLFSQNLAARAHADARRGRRPYSDVLAMYRRVLRRSEASQFPASPTAINVAQAEVEAGDVDAGEQHALDDLRRAHRRGLHPEIAFAVMVLGQAALARGETARGLQLIAAAAVGGGSQAAQEIDEVLDMYDVDAETLPVVARSDVEPLDTLVERILDEHPADSTARPS